MLWQKGPQRKESVLSYNRRDKLRNMKDLEQELKGTLHQLKDVPPDETLNMWQLEFNKLVLPSLMSDLALKAVVAGAVDDKGFQVKGTLPDCPVESWLHGFDLPEVLLQHIRNEQQVSHSADDDDDDDDVASSSIDVGNRFSILNSDQKQTEENVKLHIFFQSLC